jgi:cathepsin D
MGMGFKAISTYRANPVFQTLISQASVANRVFAFKLARTGSELYVGGTNTDLYTPPISYTAVTKQVRVGPYMTFAQKKLSDFR